MDDDFVEMYVARKTYEKTKISPPSVLSDDELLTNFNMVDSNYEEDDEEEEEEE